MTIKHVILCSGGKDSTAMYLLALERTGGDFIAVFADTGNEHPAVYEYISELPVLTGGPEILTVKADFSSRIARRREWLQSDAAPRRGWTPDKVSRVLEFLQPLGIPFVDMCMWKGAFPSRRRKFCTQHLKRIPITTEVVEPLALIDGEIWSWQGVRADESLQRSKYVESEPSSEVEGVTNYRPLLSWSVQDVVAMHKRHGIPLNPLYKLGFSRVGCFPCINANKAEIRLMAQTNAWAINKVREWEMLVGDVSKNSIATFFYSSRLEPIDERVRWSRTRRGGTQFDLLAYDATETCILAGGLCE